MMKPERRPGRPSLSGEGDSPIVRVRLPQQTLAALQSEAAAAGVSPSEYVRRAVVRALAAA
jgi:predicted DNA binding CopG/RHH family protein